MTLIYATRAQLVEYTPAAHKSKIPGEPEATRLLTAASKAVRLATLTAHYATDTAGYPTDAAVIAGFRDATCAQALGYVLDSTVEFGPSADDFDSVSIGSVSLSKRTSSRSTGAGGSALDGGLSAAAAGELAVAGLSPGNITTTAWPSW